MKTTVQKEWLLDKLQHNMSAHREIFLKAQKGYREQAITLFEKNLKAARDGKRFEAWIHMTPPMDQTKEYKRAVAMVERHEGKTVELSETDYAQLVLDDWEWKRQFIATNSTYTAIETGDEE